MIHGQKILFGVRKSSGAFYRIESYIKVGDDLLIQEGIAYGKDDNHEDVVRMMNYISPMIHTIAEDVRPLAQVSV